MAFTLSMGSAAPNFSLRATDGKTYKYEQYTLSGYINKYIGNW